MRVRTILCAQFALLACSRTLEARYDDYQLEESFVGDGSQISFPNPPPPPPGAPGPLKTIYEFITESPLFTNLSKALHFDNETAQLLNDSSASITFFAVPDWALKPPKGHKHPPLEAAALVDDSGAYDLFSVTAALERLHLVAPPDDDHRRKFLKKILHAILSYHILSDAYDAPSLAANITYPTTLSLPDGSLDGKPLRIHVTGGPFAQPVKVNFLSKVSISDIASNGLVHTISRPLFPPPSIFQEAFLLQKVFSTYTSAIQRVGLTDEVDLRWVPGHHNKTKGSNEGTAVVTSFIPLNRAFEKLPLRLRLFLFSPFGERALKKLLQLHTVPSLVLHSNYLYNSTSGEEITLANTLNEWTQDISVFEGAYEHETFASLLLGEESRYAGLSSPPRLSWVRRIVKGTMSRLLPTSIEAFSPPPGRPPVVEPVFAVNLTVPTLLANHTLDIHIAKFKIQIPIPGPHPPPPYYAHKFLVNGQRVAVSDVPARNGAAHVLPLLINPFPKKKGPPGPSSPPHASHCGGERSSEWEDWEDWLPKWADEN